MAKNKNEVLANPANIQELKQFVRNNPGVVSAGELAAAKLKLTAQQGSR